MLSARTALRITRRRRRSSDPAAGGRRVRRLARDERASERRPLLRELVERRLQPGQRALAAREAEAVNRQVVDQARVEPVLRVAVVALRLHVGLDALESAVVHQPLETPGQRLQRVVLAHPLLLFLARAVVAVDVTDVVAVVAIRLALEERGPLAAARALDQLGHG